MVQKLTEQMIWLATMSLVAIVFLSCSSTTEYQPTTTRQISDSTTQQGRATTNESTQQPEKVAPPATTSIPLTITPPKTAKKIQVSYIVPTGFVDISSKTKSNRYRILHAESTGEISVTIWPNKNAISATNSLEKLRNELASDTGTKLSNIVEMEQSNRLVEYFAGNKTSADGTRLTLIAIAFHYESVDYNVMTLGVWPSIYDDEIILGLTTFLETLQLQME